MSKEITKKIKKLLSDNPLAAPALVAAKYDFGIYTDEDWYDYKEETNNPIPSKSLPSSPIEKMIDEQTGFAEDNEVAILIFILWWVEGFIQGMKEGGGE